MSPIRAAQRSTQPSSGRTEFATQALAQELGTATNFSLGYVPREGKIGSCPCFSRPHHRRRQAAEAVPGTCLALDFPAVEPWTEEDEQRNPSSSAGAAFRGALLLDVRVWRAHRRDGPMALMISKPCSDCEPSLW